MPGDPGTPLLKTGITDTLKALLLNTADDYNELLDIEFLRNRKRKNIYRLRSPVFERLRYPHKSMKTVLSFIKRMLTNRMGIR